MIYIYTIYLSICLSIIYDICMYIYGQTTWRISGFGLRFRYIDSFFIWTARKKELKELDSFFGTTKQFSP